MQCQCNVCSAWFEAKYPWQNKCSAACTVAMKRQKANAHAKRAYALNPNPPIIKPCVICGTPFRVIKTKKTCSKECSRAAFRIRHREWSAMNKDRTNPIRNAQQIKRYHARVEEKREYARDWYRSKRSQVLASCRRRRQANLEKYRQRDRDLYIKEPLRMRAKSARFRAIRKSAPGSHTKEDLQEILKSQRHRCGYCRTKLTARNVNIDHIKPISRGGSNDRRNLQALCRDCNLSKSAKDPIEFAQANGLLL